MAKATGYQIISFVRQWEPGFYLVDGELAVGQNIAPGLHQPNWSIQSTDKLFKPLSNEYELSRFGFIVNGDTEMRWPFEEQFKIWKESEFRGKKPEVVRPTQHHGVSRHRLLTNCKEKAFADAWEVEGPKLLGYLVTEKNNNTPGDYSRRDAQVAASIIQWLGSPVGIDFIDRIRGSDEYKKEMQ